MATTIDKMLAEGQLGLVRTVENELEDVTLSDLLQYPGNEAVFAALGGVREKVAELPSERAFEIGGKNVYREKTALKMCKEVILDFVLQNVHRPPNVVRGTNHEMIQRMYKGTVTPRSVPSSDAGMPQIPRALESMTDMATVDRGFPSEADKRPKRNPGILDHNINMGAVIARDSSGRESVVAVRSGKANTLNRAQELARFALRQEIDTGNYAALKPVKNQAGDAQAVKDGNKVYEYRPAINGHMDLGFAKKYGSKVGVGENEFKYTMAIAKSIDQWPPEGYRVLAIITDAAGNPEEVEIVIMRPVLSNQPLSSQVAGAGFSWGAASECA